MTPTSGASPYTFNVTFEDADRFGAAYAFEFAQVTNQGVCVIDITLGGNSPSIASTLLASGTYTLSTAEVPAGSCRTANARIRRLADNKIISGMSVTIDNV